MLNDARDRRIKEFASQCTTWIVVRHFLSASLTAELCEALVSTISRGEISFVDLFVGDAPESTSLLSNWCVWPRPVSSPLARFLQNLVKAIIWQGDTWLSVDKSAGTGDVIKFMQEIAASLVLSELDLSAIGKATVPLREAADDVRWIIDTIDNLGLEDGAVQNEIIKSLIFDSQEKLQMPLRVIVIKHIGDLLVDSGQWSIAQGIFEKCQDLLSSSVEDEWIELTRAMRSIIAQSQAAAIWHLEGPEAASRSLTSRELMGHNLYSLNSALDAMNALQKSSESFSTQDIRPAILLAPQLIYAHRLDRALEYSLEGGFDHAHRWFWAVLRRQIAFGSVTAANSTKAHYGRSLVDEAERNLTKGRAAESLALGIRLLLEGASVRLAEESNWSKELVTSYINISHVESVLSRVNQVPGMKRERALVAIVLFRKWLNCLPPDSADVASLMLDFIATSALGQWSIFSDRNIADAGFSALQEVAKHRPEFRMLAAETLTEAVVTKLSYWELNAQLAALKTAEAYLEAFTPEQLRIIVDAIILLLSKNEKANHFPVIGQALSLLASPTVDHLCSTDHDLKRKVSRTLIHSSLESDTENTRLLFLLRNIAPDIVNEIDVERMISLVSDVRRKANQINSTTSSGSIFALLLAAPVTKIEGVRDAISCLCKIVESAANGKPFISFSNAYSSVLYLSQSRTEIIRGLGITTRRFNTMVTPLLDPLLRVWRQASTSPLIFGGFAIPAPSRPNSTIVHNWTFATLGFARSMGKVEEFDRAMQPAMNNPILESAMSVARAVRLVAGDPERFDLSALCLEKHDAFYAGLGRRLVLLRNIAHESRKPIISLFVAQCLKFGPDGRDAAVFATALAYGVSADYSKELSAYRQRVDNDQNLRFTLIPLLDELRISKN